MTTSSKKPKFTYDSTLTEVERTFITSMVQKQDIDALVNYLEDCVLWKRQQCSED